MKRLLTTLLLTALVVFHTGVGRAETLTLKQAGQTLNEIKSAIHDRKLPSADKGAQRREK